MSGSVASAAEKANGGSAPSCTQSSTSRHLTSALVATLRAVFPRKTWAHLISITLISERTAKYRMTGKREFTADELARLLRSEHGLDFLAAVMADAEPRWWLHVRAAAKLGAMRRRKQELQEAINETERLAASLARAETALCISDPDFHRPFLDALGASRGGVGRALAR